jgi:hypothetical protein
VGDLLAKVSLGSLLHLGEDHGGNLLGGELLLGALGLDRDHGLVGAVDKVEGPVLAVLLDVTVLELAADETLGVEDGVLGVLGGLVLGGISDETLVLSECDPRGGDTVSLVVGDDFNLAALLD